ncbi:MAG: hypothetical protein JSU63_16875 [Phycisphaerales bacterium]|nr:MAG: hypothetical protein JSU63_16875 [Phycisphaerales bacterium]
MSFVWGMPGGYMSPATAELAKSRQSGDAKTARAKARELEERLDRAMLACEAMWSLLRDKLGVTDVELVQRINDLDLSDGKLDGKVRKSAVSCPKCNRTISPRFPQCMYCGQPIVHDPFA